MIIQIETDRNLQNKNQEQKVRKLIEDFNRDLTSLDFKVIKFTIPQFREDRK